MLANTFDAITYMDDLINVGVSEPQAKVQSKALTHAIEEVVTRDLATKIDLLEVETSLKQDISKVETKLEKNILKVESSLKQEIATVEVRLIKWMIGVNATMFGLLVAFFKLVV
jgi:5'-deoxynucleotidase YfbR-like HD superfamily hydrolase